MAVNGGGQPKGNQGIQRNEIHQLTMSSSGHESMLIFTNIINNAYVYYKEDLLANALYITKPLQSQY